MQSAEELLVRTSITLRSKLMADAKALGVNISRHCQASLEQEVARIKGARWYEDNKEAIDAYNAHVRNRGVALERQRVW